MFKILELVTWLWCKRNNTHGDLNTHTHTTHTLLMWSLAVMLTASLYLSLLGDSWLNNTHTHTHCNAVCLNESNTHQTAGLPQVNSVCMCVCDELWLSVITLYYCHSSVSLYLITVWHTHRWSDTAATAFTSPFLKRKKETGFRFFYFSASCTLHITVNVK